MDTYDAVIGRRSIRKFQNKKVPFDILQKCIEAARMAPSAMNLQPLEYIIIEEEQLVKKMFECTEWNKYSFKNGPQPGEEPTAYILVLSNNKIKTKNPQIDAGLAIENILLTAYAQGVASCCMGATKKKEIIELLKIPEDYSIQNLIVLGYAKQVSKTVDEDSIRIKQVDDEVRVSKRPLSKIMHRNCF